MQYKSVKSVVPCTPLKKSRSTRLNRTPNLSGAASRLGLVHVGSREIVKPESCVGLLEINAIFTKHVIIYAKDTQLC